ncbi:hypothetical protein [Gilliamella apicola]|uniref:Uncharacterized protein n=1 Tax=Gilliamella apicola TaxID=1196095 RepID=A0A242NM62_9GAMM|nr:hypothetical protein [Gilliamella apicola]OTP81183.1 hypothetical protein B5S40_12770 [Gilliamella apicola]OTP83551.1 hypothetical protein B5S44_12120 [Gilliamella apicola]OTQ01208.1 hypothetical protein B6D08_02100 [Gilliamella apicola]OTQ10036.1 hypothetical protein B6C91_06975 [Gilliamella apicola]OTQ17036.1 hypothetical protein B6D11_02875 [Gilliamella apicola]
MNNHQLVCKVEGTLLQVKSMAKIALDNTNYKLSGYEEPFIDQSDMSNLLWAIVDLAEMAFDDLQEYRVLEVKNDCQ